MDLARRVKKLRKHFGWSQRKLAEAIGVEYKSIHRWESGKTKPKSDIVIAAIERLEKQCGLHDERKNTGL